MPTFDRTLFFADFTARTGLALTVPRRAAIAFLIDRCEADKDFAMLSEIAYLLATIRWETGHTFLPIEEKRADPQRQAALWQRQEKYWNFHGRGYVQLTWDYNYRRAGKELQGQVYKTSDGELSIGADTFLARPELVMEPAISYDIAARGMRAGWFTGKRLSNYIRDGSAPDYVGARRIINALDHAEDIARFATEFELLLRSASAAPALPQFGVEAAARKRKAPAKKKRSRGKKVAKKVAKKVTKRATKKRAKKPATKRVGAALRRR
jgi:hypothetical protein